MLTEAELQKQWERLTFTDDFIFSRVMHDENICRQVVELILGVRIGKIHYLSAQDEHKTDLDSMRIIMDVFLRDDNRIITVEMQTGHKKELPKRSRYYQSVADVSTTPTGAKYRNLPDNILIFICTFNPFDRDLPRYTFQYTCDEDPTLKLQDGSLRIFLNATANHLDSLDQKLQAFYHYLQEGVVESELARTISESITTLKNNSLERRHYMTWAVKMADARYDGYDEGYEEGISIGLERGAYQNKLETARSMLDYGDAPEKVALCTGLPMEIVLKLIG
ncbi:MAG: Rpn family recombination-promoting nuclease/putative transposase [Spirochaetaceae bacterium]|nr:Rpn family recombination-promoting nuclease/putative transposase [Spirochaetaceae bacterium]